MARGVAADNAETREFLQNCGAVEGVHEAEGYLGFTYDPKKQPDTWPAGVYFDLAVAPF